MRIRAAYRWCLLTLLLLFLAGILSACTTTEEVVGGSLSAQTDPLIVARIGNSALLSWQSSAENEYTVLYADGSRVGAEWRPLEGASRVRGTGGEIRIEDQMPPNRIRYYRLMITPLGHRR